MISYLARNAREKPKVRKKWSMCQVYGGRELPNEKNNKKIKIKTILIRNQNDIKNNFNFQMKSSLLEKKTFFKLNRFSF